MAHITGFDIESPRLASSPLMDNQREQLQRRIEQVCEQVNDFVDLNITVYDRLIEKQLVDYLDRLLEMNLSGPFPDQTAAKLSLGLLKLRRMKLRLTELKFASSQELASTVTMVKCTSDLEQFGMPNQTYRHYTYEELLQCELQIFDGNLLQWSSYRTQLNTLIMPNPNLSGSQCFKLIWRTLSFNVRKRLILKVRVNNASNLCALLSKHFGPGQSAFQKLCQMIENEVPQLKVNDTMENWQKLRDMTREVLSRHYYGYLSRAQQAQLYTDLSGKLTSNDHNILHCKFDYKQPLLPYLARFVEFRYSQICNQQ